MSARSALATLARLYSALSKSDGKLYGIKNGEFFEITAAGGVGDLIVGIGSSATNSTTTNAAIPGATVTLPAVAKYEIEATVQFMTAAAATGLQLGFELDKGPFYAGSSLVFEIGQGAAGSAYFYTRAFAGLGSADSALAPNSPGSSVAGVATVRGVIDNLEAGAVFRLMFASEVAGSLVTITAGAVVKATRLT